MRLRVIVNPTSGGGRAWRFQPAVADYFRSQGVRAEFVESESAEDLERLAAEAPEAGHTHLAILGGDGAFHHAVNGACGRDVVLGFLPCGNGNDIALGLGMRTDPVAAARDFLRLPPQPVDVLRARCAGGRPDATGRLFVGAGGLGLDAEAAALVHGEFRRLPGVVRYVASALWAFRRFQPLRLAAQLDEQTWHGTVLFAVAANSPSYGAGLKIAPAARMNDGWMNVTLVHDLSWTRVVEAILPLLRTGELPWPEIQRLRCRRARFTTDRKALFHGDGELIGETPVEVEVLPGAIQMAGIPAAAEKAE